MARRQDQGFAICVLFALFEVTNALRCGSWLCYGAGAYCCGNGCCYEVWSLWWFWMLWVVLFTLLISCGFWCRRRRRQRPEYILVRGPTDTYYGGPVCNGRGRPAYGAVTTTDGGTHVVYGVYPSGGPVSSAPAGHTVVPPAYTPQTKPPGYSQQPNQ